LERTLIATTSLVGRKKERMYQRIESGRLLIISAMVENAKCD